MEILATYTTNIDGIISFKVEPIKIEDIKEFVQYKYGDSIESRGLMHDIYEASGGTSLYMAGTLWARIIFNDDTRNNPFNKKDYKPYRIALKEIGNIKEIPYRVETID